MIMIRIVRRTLYDMICDVHQAVLHIGLYLRTIYQVWTCLTLIISRVGVPAVGADGVLALLWWEWGEFLLLLVADGNARTSRPCKYNYF